MRILLNRKPLYDQAWGGGNLFLQAFCDAAKRKGHEIVYQLDGSIDVIFMHDPRPSELKIGVNEIARYVHGHRRTKVVHRVNECDARKGTKDVDELLQRSSQIVDATIFVSRWMRHYHVGSGVYMGGKHHIIHNGVDRQHFQPATPTIKSPITRIVAHHWSNNRMKGFDVYEAIDEFVARENGFMFTYIGRENGTFKNARVIAPLFGRALGERLADHDVYISGSLHDPGPNHILEALACGLPTYVDFRGGGAVEFADPEHTFRTIDQLFGILRSKTFDRNRYIPSTWEQSLDQYFQVIEGLV